MNFQAVLLFICISTACGLMCNDGREFSNGESEEKPSMVQCNNGSTMCKTTEKRKQSTDSYTVIKFECGGLDCMRPGCQDPTFKSSGDYLQVCCGGVLPPAGFGHLQFPKGGLDHSSGPPRAVSSTFSILAIVITLRGLI